MSVIVRLKEPKMTIKEPTDRLSEAVSQESKKFEECYRWLESSMSQEFFDEMSHEQVMLVTHALMDFPLQNYFSIINLKHGALAVCLNTPDADLRILMNFSLHGIQHYRAFVSDCPLLFGGDKNHLRVAYITFTEARLEIGNSLGIGNQLDTIHHRFMEQHPELTDDEFSEIVGAIDPQFLSSLNDSQKEAALDLLYRATKTDHCQYEVQHIKTWEEGKSDSERISTQIILAWRNTPKYHFLYRVARTIFRHHLVIRRVNATYVNPYSRNSILIMVLGVHGADDRPSWEAAAMPDFLRELITLKYFESFDKISKQLVAQNYIPRLMGNFLRALVSFAHQNLVNIDPHFYTAEHIEEDLCRHPELTSKLCEAFTYKFDPDHVNLEQFGNTREELIEEIDQLDTGHEDNDKRRRNVLLQGINFIDHILKTNLYCFHYTAISFRLDPNYLNCIPFDRDEKYPDLPYGIFFVKGLDFFGFHIRFGDLARGGVRTVFPEQIEHMLSESNNVFNECYNLAHTQHKKNKDIPEAGAKGVIFIRSYDRLEAEADILQNELSIAGCKEHEIKTKVEAFRKEQKYECLHLAQRSFIESVLTIVNTKKDQISLKAERVVNYWDRPEYLYLGPDENMHNSMIQWIADYSRNVGYKPGTSFITSKPKAGINHKEYGVTSLGVNVYMEETLKFLGINPYKDTFTVKMSGGPDGDVAGNQILNLKKHYPNTAKLIALTDISGTIYDPCGLDLNILAELFRVEKPISHYPPSKLNEDAFLVDRTSTQSPTAYTTQTLCWKNFDGEVMKTWISGSEMNHLARHNVHSTYADVFIPAGGRPRTLNQDNWKDYLDNEGVPTSRAIIEGANLYLSPIARRKLEEVGTLIIRDSSANKTGVICSSLEVLIGLTLNDDEFLKLRETLVSEIYEHIKICALNEAKLLLNTHKATGKFLTEISEEISEKINLFTYQLLEHLDKVPLSENLDNPLVSCFLNYALPTLRKEYLPRLMKEIPEHHKKAIIASQIASHQVYTKGVDWSPSIVDILPTVWAI